MHPSLPMYLATVLLEPNRWRRGHDPVLRLDATWLEQIAQGGFDGLELWENHYHTATAEARKVIRSGPSPVRIFNWYGLPGSEQEYMLLHALDEIGDTVEAVKFNLGKERGDLPREASATAQLAARLGPRIRLICECHAGTSMEDPREAARVFADWPASIVAAVHPFTDGAAAWFDVLGPRIRHLHFHARSGEHWQDPVPGLPAVDAGIALLQRHGFTGTASLEFVAGITSGLTPEELLAGAIRVRGLLAPALGIPARMSRPSD